MEDLRLAIIVLGVFSILGILVHGLWTIRKNAADKDNNKDRKEPDLGEQKEWNQPESEVDTQIDFSDDDPLLSPAMTSESELQPEPEIKVRPVSASDGYDEDGIGQVRTIAKENVEPKPFTAKEKPVIDPIEEEDPIPEPPGSLLQTSIEEESKPTAGNKTEAKPEPKAKASLAERARQLVNGGEKKERRSSRRLEPKLNEEQIRMDFDTRQMHIEDVDGVQEPKNEPDTVEQEVLVLNVKMPEGKSMSGASLLPALLTLGFKFGEQDVFHRHAASNGKGPKLFSLANMFKPGTFNVDNMETFQTQGISLFMILPIEGDPQQVFNMMHNAARKLADEFGAQILDSRRSLLTKQSLQQYVEKIREFERKRMINKV